MHMNATMIPLGALIALLMLTWYLLAMPVFLQGSRGYSQAPSAAVVLEAGR